MLPSVNREEDASENKLILMTTLLPPTSLPYHPQSSMTVITATTHPMDTEGNSTGTDVAHRICQCLGRSVALFVVPRFATLRFTQ